MKLRVGHLLRVLFIQRTLVRHGFDEILFTVPVLRPLSYLRYVLPWNWFGRQYGPRGPRLRAVLEELGPLFVKFGQLLSTRPDLVPQDIIVELRRLQDSARPEPFEAIRGVVEDDLGLTLEQAFESFDPVPIGSASVGQVHVARLPGGQEVVVKVQRPGAAATLAADIDLLYKLAALAKDRVKRLSFIDLTSLVDEFARTVRHELDYRNEARSCEAVGRSGES